MLSGSVRFRRSATAAGMAAVVGLAGCSGGESTRAGQGDGFVSGNGAVRVFEPAERPAAPELAGKTLDDEQWSLADHRGKVVVVNVWGSWCAPCRAEAPALVKAAEQVKAKARFVGINTRDLDKAPARRFVAEAKITYPSLYDPSGKLLLGFRGVTSPSAIPSTLVIDAHGKVAARVLGEVTAATLVGLVNDAAG